MEYVQVVVLETITTRMVLLPQLRELLTKSIKAAFLLPLSVLKNTILHQKKWTYWSQSSQKKVVNCSKFKLNVIYNTHTTATSS